MTAVLLISLSGFFTVFFIGLSTVLIARLDYRSIVIQLCIGICWIVSVRMAVKPGFWIAVCYIASTAAGNAASIWYSRWRRARHK